MILQNDKMINIKISNHLYNYILDIIDTKTSAFKQITPKKPHKHICIVKFDNKAIETIRFPKIFVHSDIFKMLPYNLQKKDNILTVRYKLGNTIRNNVLNYKDLVNSIYVDE